MPPTSRIVLVVQLIVVPVVTSPALVQVTTQGNRHSNKRSKSLLHQPQDRMQLLQGREQPKAALLCHIGQGGGMFILASGTSPFTVSQQLTQQHSSSSPSGLQVGGGRAAATGSIHVRHVISTWGLNAHGSLQAGELTMLLQPAQQAHSPAGVPSEAGTIGPKYVTPAGR